MFDLIVHGGVLYGTGGEPEQADIGIVGDRIALIGKADGVDALVRIDAAGMVVAPGFINVLSHSPYAMLYDPRSLGELTQGVTTQIFGEAMTMGPLRHEAQEALERGQARFGLQVTWDRLSGLLNELDRRGTSQNFASFVSHGCLRRFVMGSDRRPATPAELEEMRQLLAEEMAEGALGLASALVYPPEVFASTDDVIELAKIAALYGGGYISHLRDEDAELPEAVDELIRVSREAALYAEIYHLKVKGRANWPMMPQVLETIEQARSQGFPIAANVYPYDSCATWLTTIIPNEFHEGGMEALLDRLSDPTQRAVIRKAVEESEQQYFGADTADRVRLLRVAKEEHRDLQGMTLARIAEDRGVEPLDVALDLIRDDRSRLHTAFYAMSEENFRRQLTKPWVSVGSDGTSMAPEGPFLDAIPHPRDYGSFARIFGKYVREEKVLSLAEAVERMTRLPARRLGLEGRGELRPGNFADIVVFDPETITDRATFEDPHQLSVGVRDVIVNGKAAIRDSQFAGEFPGRRLRRGKA